MKEKQRGVLDQYIEQLATRKAFQKNAHFTSFHFTLIPKIKISSTK
jgi:hypothetical protein